MSTHVPKPGAESSATSRTPRATTCLRIPPRLARRLLEHCRSGYQADSLAGDLFEEYQQGRSRLWYWKEISVALLFAGARRARSALPKSAARALRRATKRLIAIFAITALGVGTLTWAATTHKPTCPEQAPACHKSR